MIVNIFCNDKLILKHAWNYMYDSLIWQAYNNILN